MLPFVVALHQEQTRIQQRRSPDRQSWNEAEVVSRGKAAAEQLRDDGAARIDQLCAKAAAMRSEIAVVEGDIGRLAQRPVRGDREELLTAAEAEQRCAIVAEQITKEADAGSRRHQQMSSVMRTVVRLIPLIDLPVLTMFSADIFNLPWDAAFEVGNVPRLLTSLTFGLLGTVVLAVGLHAAGEVLRQYKNDQGGVDLPSSRGTLLTTLLLSGVGGISIGASVLMGYRVVHEALMAETGLLGGIILGLFFAGVVTTANLVVVLTIFRNGSTLTDELGRLRMQLAAIRQQRLGLERQREALATNVEVLVTEAEQLHALTLAKMTHPINGAHQVVAIARSLHQGCGWQAELLVPDSGAFGLFAPLLTLDTTVLDESLKRIAAQRVSSAAPRFEEGRSDLTLPVGAMKHTDPSVVASAA
ncbi:hypothetical protein [Nocardia aurea]|uniref:Uncharacterized protein n=1 Tax=Nocardia aurea TaxID=2144174 RepID=A0ABV3FY88_9NOCA